MPFSGIFPEKAMLRSPRIKKTRKLKSLEISFPIIKPQGLKKTGRLRPVQNPAKLRVPKPVQCQGRK